MAPLGFILVQAIVIGAILTSAEVYKGGLKNKQDAVLCVQQFQAEWKCGSCKREYQYCWGNSTLPLRKKNLTIVEIFESGRCQPLNEEAFQVWCQTDRKKPNSNDTFHIGMKCSSNCFYDLVYDSNLNFLFEEICKEGSATKGAINFNNNQTAIKLVKNACSERKSESKPKVEDPKFKFPVYAIVLLALAAFVSLVTICAVAFNSRQKDHWHRVSTIGSKAPSGLASAIEPRSTLPSDLPSALQGSKIRASALVSEVSVRPSVRSGHSRVASHSNRPSATKFRSRSSSRDSRSRSTSVSRSRR